MPLFAGIDLGTTTIKLLIVNEKGDLIVSENSEYEIQISNAGYAEQNPEDWSDALEKILYKASKQCNFKEILSIGFSGQMHGIVLLDKDCKVLRPCIIWMDQRTEKESKEITEIAGEDLLKNELLNKPVAGMFMSSLLWIKRNEKEIYEKTSFAISPKDYIRFYLTGEIYTDETDASATMAFSVKNKKWADELLDKLEIEKGIFPKVLKPYQNGGKIKKYFAEKYNFDKDVYVALGAGDSAMQLLGNGITKKGVVTSNIGTASQVATVVEAPIYDKSMRLQTWCYVEENLWYIQGGSLSGGRSLKWLKTNVLENKYSYSELDRRAFFSKAGADGLIFLPYLSAERTPFLNPSAKGCFFGLTLKHSKDDMIRAVMEGVVYNLSFSLGILNKIGIKPEKIIASGGGSKGKAWKQIQADIFSLPVYTTKAVEEACLGAIIVGAYGAGYYSTLRQACDNLVKFDEDVVLPDLENSKYYRKKQELFKKIYYNNETLFKEL